MMPVTRDHGKSENLYTYRLVTIATMVRIILNGRPSLPRKVSATRPGRRVRVIRAASQVSNRIRVRRGRAAVHAVSSRVGIIRTHTRTEHILSPSLSLSLSLSLFTLSICLPLPHTPYVSQLDFSREADN